MSEKLEQIVAYVAVTIGTIVIAVAFFGGITYVAAHEKTVILHSDYGDFSCAYAQYPNGDDIIRYYDKIEDTK